MIKNTLVVIFSAHTQFLMSLGKDFMHAPQTEIAADKAVPKEADKEETHIQEETDIREDIKEIKEGIKVIKGALTQTGYVQLGKDNLLALGTGLQNAYKNAYNRISSPSPKDPASQGTEPGWAGRLVNSFYNPSQAEAKDVVDPPQTIETESSKGP